MFKQAHISRMSDVAAFIGFEHFLKMNCNRMFMQKSQSNQISDTVNKNYKLFF
jgi:hypothetical protein